MRGGCPSFLNKWCRVGQDCGAAWAPVCFEPWCLSWFFSTELGNLSLTKEVVQKIKVLIYKDMAKTNQLFGFQHFLLVR